MQSDRDARIRERAYRIWEEEGRVEGRHEEHWRRAEREIADEEARAEQVRNPDRATGSDPGGAGPKTVKPGAPPARRPARLNEARGPAPAARGRRTASKPRS